MIARIRCHITAWSRALAMGVGPDFDTWLYWPCGMSTHQLASKPWRPWTAAPHEHAPGQTHASRERNTSAHACKHKLVATTLLSRPRPRRRDKRLRRGSGGLRLSFGTGEVGREDEVGHTHSRLVLHLSLLTPGVFDSAWVRVGLLELDSAWVRVGLLELGGPSMSLQQREQDS